MADPISILSLTIEFTPKIIQLILDIKDGFEERRRLVAEISYASGILSVLKELSQDAEVERSWNNAISTISQPNGPLSGYWELLESIWETLKPKGRLRSAGRALAWLFQGEEVQKYLREIERYKSYFTLALQIDNK